MRRLRAEQVDRLLRDALHEPSSFAEEARLRAAMRAAWRRARQGFPDADGQDGARLPILAMRTAVGAGAVLALATALALQAAFPPRLVAASLAERNASLGALDQLRRAAAMDCVAEVDDRGVSTPYRVAWRPAATTIRVGGPEGTTWTTRVPPEETGLVGAGGLDLGREDPLLAPVREVLSPERVVALVHAGRAWSAPGPASALIVRLAAGGRASCEITSTGMATSLAAGPGDRPGPS